MRTPRSLPLACWCPAGRPGRSCATRRAATVAAKVARRIVLRICGYLSVVGWSAPPWPRFGGRRKRSGPGLPPDEGREDAVSTQVSSFRARRWRESRRNVSSADSPRVHVSSPNRTSYVESLTHAVVRRSTRASGAGDGLDRVGGRRGSVRPLDRARREDRLAPVADGERRGDEAIEQRVRSLGS